MTREEARKILQKLATNSLCVEDYSNDKIKISSRMGAQALRPVSRETVEKVWRGEWEIAHDKEQTIVVCSKCGEETVYDFILEANELVDFCPVCGAPLTDEAVEMVIERMEALNDGKDDRQ